MARTCVLGKASKPAQQSRGEANEVLRTRRRHLTTTEIPRRAEGPMMWGVPGHTGLNNASWAF